MEKSLAAVPDQKAVYQDKTCLLFAVRAFFLAEMHSLSRGLPY